MAWSTIKQKRGKCPECEPEKREQNLFSGLCQTHYRKKQQQKAFEKAKNKEPVARVAIRPVSDKEAARLRKYYPIARKFKEENPECQIMVEGCTHWTTEVHHPEGREGDLLCKVELFVGVCHNCHMWAEGHPTEAKAKGVSRNRVANND